MDLDSDSTDKYDSTQEAREALEGYIVSYSKDSDGLYTLTKRSDNRIDLKDNTFNDTGLEIKSGTSAMKIFATDDYYANSSTIFLLYDGDDYTVYTGIKNVPDVKGDADTNAVVFDKGGVAKVVSTPISCAADWTATTRSSSWWATPAPRPRRTTRPTPSTMSTRPWSAARSSS